MGGFGAFGGRGSGQIWSQSIMQRVTASRRGVEVDWQYQSGLARRIAVAELLSGRKRKSTSAGVLHSVQCFA